MSTTKFGIWGVDPATSSVTEEGEDPVLGTIYLAYINKITDRISPIIEWIIPICLFMIGSTLVLDCQEGKKSRRLDILGSFAKYKEVSINNLNFNR